MKLLLFVLGAVICQVAFSSKIMNKLEELEELQQLETLLHDLEARQEGEGEMGEMGEMGDMGDMDAISSEESEEEEEEEYEPTEIDMLLDEFMAAQIAEEDKMRMEEEEEAVATKGLDEQLSEDDHMRTQIFDDLLEKHLQKRSELAEETRGLKSIMSGPAKKHGAYLQASPDMITKGNTALAYLDAVREYKQQWEEKRGLKDDEQFDIELRQISLRNPRTRTIFLNADQERAPQPGECLQIRRDCSNVRDSKFRTFDGSCNNLVSGRENYGSINQAMTRFLPTAYGDGLFSPRVSNGRVRLPTARQISKFISQRSNIPEFGESGREQRESPINSLHMMQIGQFLDHDVTLAPAQGEEVRCDCNTPTNDNCFIIPLERGHSLFPCIPLRRSIPILNGQCALNRFEQANSLTSWVDGSHIYGLSVTNSTLLRDPRSRSQFGRSQGRMVTRTNPETNDRGDQLLPRVAQCDTPPICPFNAGDIRANEQTGLASMHTVFVLLHNFFEGHLNRVNPGRNSERLFQETRRLVTAVWQNIAFNEYLQIILGRAAFERFDLGRNDGEYNALFDPQTANEFSAAAMRFGHTEIADEVPFVNSFFGQRIDTELAEQFEGEVENIYLSPVKGTNAVDALMLGMADTPAQDFDTFFVNTIRERLFVEKPEEQGFDLPALNIQRARDHGVSGYGEALNFCRLGVNTNRLKPELVQDLLNIYGDGQPTVQTLNNIDLFIGGISELPTSDGQLGPTFTCLVANQFRRMKLGDRLYYGHRDAGFTRDQIATIESYRLSSVLCDALPDVLSMQPRALLQPFSSTPNDVGLRRILGSNFNNNRVDCSRLPKLNFNLFRF